MRKVLLPWEHKNAALSLLLFPAIHVMQTTAHWFVLSQLTQSENKTYSLDSPSTQCYFGQCCGYLQFWVLRSFKTWCSFWYCSLSCFLQGLFYLEPSLWILFPFWLQRRKLQHFPEKSVGGEPALLTENKPLGHWCRNQDSWVLLCASLCLHTPGQGIILANFTRDVIHVLGLTLSIVFPDLGWSAVLSVWLSFHCRNSTLLILLTFREVGAKNSNKYSWVQSQRKQRENLGTLKWSLQVCWCSLDLFVWIFLVYNQMKLWQEGLQLNWLYLKG